MDTEGHGQRPIRRAILLQGCGHCAPVSFGLFGQNTEKGDEAPAEAVTSDAYADQLGRKPVGNYPLYYRRGRCTGNGDAGKHRQTGVATQEKKSAGSTEEQTGESTVRAQSSDDSETSYILVKESDGSQKALAVTEISPEIRGVVVVCGGSSDPELQQKIIDAVTTALQISSARVCVVGRG